MAKARQAPSTKELQWFGGFDPNDLVDRTGQLPSFHFEWREPGRKKGEKLPPQRRRKRRMIGIPNAPMVSLHKLFRMHLDAAIMQMGEGNDNKDNFTLRRLPSSTGCVLGSNHFKNAQIHAGKRFLYITDFSAAYPSLDLRRLTLLLVFIFRYQEYRLDYSIKQFARNELAHYAMETDPLYPRMEAFVKMAFAGLHGEGLAVGGTLSPYLLNLYCEVFLDSRMRAYCERLENKREPERNILYSRYVDDLVWSSDTLISSERRREWRRIIGEAGFDVNHWKSKVLDTKNGTVFVTKVGFEDRDGERVLVFPKKKRRRLEGIIKSYLAVPFQMDNPEVIAGLAAEFLYYYKQVAPTKSDERTFALCRQFEETAHKYLGKMRHARNENEKQKRPRGRKKKP